MEIHYDPVTPVENIFNKVKDLLKYGDMENCPYSHPQVILKDYKIINKTDKFQESIKYWNYLPPIQKTWSAFKTYFCEAHLELTNTV